MNASQLQVIGLKTLQITFRRWNLRIQVLADFPWIYFCLWCNCNYFDSTQFAFAMSVLLIFNVLMVRKEEFFIKSPKLQETMFIITN